MSRLPARIHPSALLMWVVLLSLPGARAAAQTSWFPVTWSNPPEGPVPGVQHRTFRSAALDAEVGYNILLPPDYESSDRRYPVLYWLHGAGGNENVSVPHLAPVVREAVADGAVPPLIVVFVNGGPGTFYVDSWNGAHRVQTMIVEDLVPHIDAAYRTISSRTHRAISGMSMGGHGALALAVKHPDLFSSVVSYAPALIELVEQADGTYLTTQRGATVELPVGIRAQVVQEMFNGDPALFEPHDLWSLVPRRAAEVRGRLAIRLVVGDADPFCFVSNSEFHDLLDANGLGHDFEIVPGVDHDQLALLESVGRAGLLFHAREASWR
jgi:enterochelin esterase-like enzyme